MAHPKVSYPVNPVAGDRQTKPSWAENWKRDGQMRTFDTGATRDTETDKYDYEGFMSPLVVRRFGQYMHEHRVQADGTLRDSDNWQKGIPKDVYLKSAFRHFVDWWLYHRKHLVQGLIEDALCGLLFNVQGYLHELLLERQESDFQQMMEESLDD